jgi:Glycosyltransferase family 87
MGARVSRPIVRDSSSLATGVLPLAASALARPWALALLWVVVFAHLVRFTYRLPPTFSDFNHFYVAALSFRLGSDAYVAKYEERARSLGLDIGFINISNQPPTFVLCFELLTRLGPRAAYWTWIGFSLASFAFALALLLSAETSLAPRQMLLLCALTMLYPPLFENFYFGNTQTVILLLIVVAMLCLRRKWDSRAGFSFATATSLKAYPWILAFYLVCRCQWLTLLWMAGGGTLIGGLTLLGLGWARVFSFFGTWGFTNSRRLLERFDNVSLNAAVSRVFWFHASAPLTPDVEVIRKVTAVAAELAVFALTVAATAGAGPERRWRALSLWLVAMILLSPSSRFHYLVVLIVPFVLIVEAARYGETEPRVIYAALGSYLLTFSNYPLIFLHLHLDSCAWFLRIADEFRFVSVALAYLAAYWFASVKQSSTLDTV